MTDTLEVAGDSASLRWLLAESDKLTPWLTVTATHLQIDWEGALSGNSDQLRPLLVQVLTKLLPDLPLDTLAEWGAGRRRTQDPHAASSTVVYGEVTPINEKVLAVLSNFAKHLREMEDLIARIRGRRTKTAPDYLGKAADACRKVATLINARYLRDDLRFSYAVAERFRLSKGWTTELFAERSSFASRSNGAVIAERRRLARRLVSAHISCCEQLENFVRTGIPPADFTASCSRLGRLGHALALALTTNGRDRVNFAEVHGIFTSLRTMDQPIEDSPKSEWSANYLMPFSTLLTAIDAMWKAFQFLSMVLNAKDFAIAVKFQKEFNAIYHALVAAGGILPQRPRLSAAAIDEAVEAAFAASPLLTMLTSGFLTVYRSERTSGRFGVSLSPWTSAASVAKKALGVAPLTYLDVSGADEDAEQDEGEAKEESDSTASSGRRLWEVMKEARG